MYNVIGKVNIEIYFILYYLTAAYHEGAITANASPTKFTGCADTRRHVLTSVKQAYRHRGPLLDCGDAMPYE